MPCPVLPGLLPCPNAGVPARVRAGPCSRGMCAPKLRVDSKGNKKMTKETWGRVCNELLKTVGKSNYTTWIAPLRMIDMSEGIAAFEAPTKFMRDWVSRHPVTHEFRRSLEGSDAFGHVDHAQRRNPGRVVALADSLEKFIAHPPPGFFGHLLVAFRVYTQFRCAHPPGTGTRADAGRNPCIWTRQQARQNRARHWMPNLGRRQPSESDSLSRHRNPRLFSLSWQTLCLLRRSRTRHVPQGDVNR